METNRIPMEMESMSAEWGHKILFGSAHQLVCLADEPREFLAVVLRCLPGGEFLAELLGVAGIGS